MKALLVTLLLVLGVSVTEARAERASVVAAKAVVAATATVVKAVPKAPAATWRGLKWLAAHV